MHPDPPKQLVTIKIKKSNQIQQAKFTKYSYIYPNPPQPAKSLQSCKICPDQKRISNPTKSMQFNSKCHKSSRDHRHLPKQNETQPNHQIAAKSIQTRVDQRTQNASIIESQDCPLSPTTQTITDHAK